MLKLLLLVAWCIASFGPAEKPCLRQITIAHIGEEDKHIEPLILSTKPLRRVGAWDVPTKVVLTEEEFTRVARLVKTFDAAPHGQLSKGGLGNYGSFNVAVFDACKQIGDNAYQPKRAEDLFRFLLKNSKCFEPKNQKAVEQWLNEHLGMY